MGQVQGRAFPSFTWLFLVPGIKERNLNCSPPTPQLLPPLHTLLFLLLKGWDLGQLREGIGKESGELRGGGSRNYLLPLRKKSEA